MVSSRNERAKRWHDWLIAIAIAALVGIGVWALWGDELAELTSGAHPESLSPASGGNGGGAPLRSR